MKRQGKTLKVLRDGHPRRLADGRNAWRKMSDEQRGEFLAWIVDPANGIVQVEHEGRTYQIVCLPCS